MPLHDNKYGDIYREAEVVQLIENAINNPDASVSQILLSAEDDLSLRDEPCFVIRGQDLVASQAIKAYGDIASANAADPSFVASVRRRAEEVKDWQRKNTNFVKVPD